MMKEKARVRFNIVDFLIVVAIVCALLVMIFRGTLVELIGNVVHTDDATVTVRINGVPKNEAALPEKGDVFYYDGELFGTVTAVTYVNSVYNIADDSGETPTYVRVTDPELWDVTVVLSSVGAYLQDGFYLDGDVYLGVGKTVDIVSEKHSCEAIITAIS